jgi:Protein of unknown function (DUF2568)
MQNLTVFDAITVTVRFLLELAALGALGWWGWRTGGPTAVKLALAAGAPLVAATAWGLFVAPKATIVIGAWPRFGFELLVFGGAAVALLAIEETTAAEVFGVAAAANLALVYARGL